jgi:hypothetical protein
MHLVALALMPAMPFSDAPVASGSRAEAFAQRGYYFTFSRMPAFGLEAWKRIVDGVAADGGNTVILWIGGGFRSRRFPQTWEYNRDHANVKLDFAKTLIDYCHEKKIAVILGLTPYGYDGVNRMSLSQPSWRATGPDGKPVAKFGFHSWGFNLCPSREGVQEYMTAYAREMCLDFYPNADGLMIESSDYAVCHCKDCGSRFYDREFQFVEGITGSLLARNPKAAVFAYPHYFSGTAVPGMNAKGSRHPFDPKWTLFYTPHSAPPDVALTKQARGAIWSDDSVARRTPSAIRDAARRARREGCTGYLPSFEVFNYVPTEAEEGRSYQIGKRLKPFGFGWLKDGEPPYDELPARVVRIAYREYARDPALSDAAFRDVLGRELFGAASTAQAVDDALFLQELFAEDRTWCQAAPIVSPERMKAEREAGQLSASKRAKYCETLKTVQAVEARHRDRGGRFADLHRVAKWVSDQWTGSPIGLIAE